MIKAPSWSLGSWVRWLGLATALLTLIGLGLSFIMTPLAQELALSLVIFANRMALIEAVLGVVVCWQRRRWAWALALAVAGIITLLSGVISTALNSYAPYLAGPLLVGALGLAAMGLTGSPRPTSSSSSSSR